MAEAITLTAITAGVISHFVHDELRSAAKTAIKVIAPGAFRGSSALLSEADREFGHVKGQIIRRYSRVKTMEIFLSPEKTIAEGVLRPLFEHLFLGMELNKIGRASCRERV